MKFSKDALGKIVRVNAGTVFQPTWVNKLHNSYGWVLSLHNDRDFLVLFPETGLNTQILINPIFLEEVSPEEWNKTLHHLEYVLNEYKKFRTQWKDEAVEQVTLIQEALGE